MLEPCLPVGLSLSCDSLGPFLTCESTTGKPLVFRIDFNDQRFLYRFNSTQGKRQPLARAIGLDKKPDLHVVDATAGTLRESLQIAGGGADVTALERNPVLVHLAQHALITAQGTTSSLNEAAQRVRLLCSDSLEWLNQRCAADRNLDVIYIDPMFPERQKSALVKKDMQVLQRLHQNDPLLSEVEERRWLEACVLHAQFRVVVKRPVSAPPLANCDPAFSVSAKTIRFDVYVNRKIA